MKEPPAVTEAPPTPRINHFLPYWAVFQADVRQTLRSWVYRAWVLLSLLVSLGYLLYRFGAYHNAGIIHPATEMMSDLLRWYIFGSVTLIIILTTGTISSERGTLADSVLSRGISRYQYFLGKWHSRLITVLGTFLVINLVVIIGALVLLQDEQIQLVGSLVALGLVGTLLVLVITTSVTVSAMTNSTVLGIALVWMLLCGIGFALSFLPASYPAPDRLLRNLHHVLRGLYDLPGTFRVMAWSLGLSLGVALVGLVAFSRRDV